MSVGSVTSNPLLALNMLGRAGGSSAAASFLPAQNDAAKSAARATTLPSVAPVQLSPEALLALQAETQQQPETQSVSLEQPSIEDQFLAEARKSPMERMREQIMKSLGVTEEQLAQMPPDEKRAMEDRIREMIEEKLREARNAGQAPAESNGQMLQALL